MQAGFSNEKIDGESLNKGTEKKNELLKGSKNIKRAKRGPHLSPSNSIHI